MADNQNLLNALETKRPSTTKSIVAIIPKLVMFLLVGMISIPLWPIFWLGWLIWGRPPTVVRFEQVVRYLKLTWTVQPPPPGITLLARFALTLTIIQKALSAPIKGIAWLLDELIYGRSLNTTPVKAPLFVVSAARSGSTQITLYLEEDPELVAPNILQCMFPYLWLWRLAPRTIGRFLTEEKVRAWIRSMMPPESLERHEGDPFKTDTFDAAFYSCHLNQYAFSLGPDAIVDEFNFGKFAPHNQQLWEKDFVDFVDRIGRKTLHHAGAGNTSRRFLLKGHFLCGADALARRYPDGQFLTVIREPISRLQSALNYMRVNPADPVLGLIPWEWLAAGLTQTESDYCRAEQAWFTETGNGTRCVIRFSEFVHDLETAMQKVYQCCCDMDDLPPHVPKSHAPRERKRYSVNRSLAELGIDEKELRSGLASYIAWCQDGETMFSP
jgi:hypothetical protein